MSRGGVKGLTGTSDVTTQRFSRGFPDSNNWLVYLKMPGQNASLQDFVESVGYDGRPELLSMYLCLLLTGVMRRSPAWYQANQCALRLEIRRSSPGFGIPALPEHCVKALDRSRQ